jgi:hypothetical protein
MGTKTVLHYINLQNVLQDHDDDEEDLEDLEEMEEAWTVPDVTLPDLHIRENDVGSSTAHQQEEVLAIPPVQEAVTAVSSDTTNTATAEVVKNASENPTQVSLLFLRPSSLQVCNKANWYLAGPLFCTKPNFSQNLVLVT